MPKSNFNPANLKLSGTYTGSRKIDYQVRVTATGTNETFGVIIKNWDAQYFLQFQGGSSTVTLRKDEGDGTFSDSTEGVPIWVGDYIYSSNGGDGATGASNSVTSNNNGFIGRVTAITTGTEGDSVKKFTIDNGSGTAGIHNSAISGTAKVDAYCSYVCQLHDGSTSVLSHDASNEKFGSGKAYMHGLEFYFSGIDQNTAMQAGSYIHWNFTGFPIREYSADKMTRINKNGAHNILGWDKSQEAFSMLEDVYSVKAEAKSYPSSQTYLPYQNAVKNEPTFATRGDDTFAGIGPQNEPLYMGYPNVKQFGRDMGETFLLTNGAISVSTSVLPAFEEFCLPAPSSDDAEDANIDLTSSSQLIVGYVKGSSWLLKANRSDGVESSLNVGGTICGIYLDHETNTDIWVLYDNVSDYHLKKYTIGASGTAMSLSGNRSYKLTSASGSTLATPFMNDTVKLSDVLVLDGFVYVLASSSNYYDSDASWEEKSFGIGNHKTEYLWRSTDITSAPGSLPDIGYTAIEFTNITGPFQTSDNSNNAEVDAYWFRYLHDEWWYENTSDPGQGTGGEGYSQQEIYGSNTPDWRLKKAIHPKGLFLYSNKSGSETVAVAIPWVFNTFENEDYSHTYDTESPSSNSDGQGVIYRYKQIGPFIKQDTKTTALGAHIEVYTDSESWQPESSTSYAGIKRIALNNSSVDIDTKIDVSISGSYGSEELSMQWYGDGGQYTGLSSINSFMPNTTILQPRGIVCTEKDSVIFYDLLTLNNSKLNQNDLDGRVFLNSSISRKKYTPSENINDWKGPSQTLNYNDTASDFDWIAVTTSLSFSCFYLDDVGDVAETASWSKIDVLSSITVAIADGAGEKDNSNLLPDGTDKDDNSHYYKNFYRISMLYDGYQESCLGETLYSNASNNPFKHGHKITIGLLPDKVSPRLSHINIYRGKAFDGSATEPDLDYQLVESVSLDNSGWSSGSNGYVEYVVKDQKGKNFGSYEALTGISPAMTTNWLSYKISEQCAGYLFVGDANNPEITNVGNYIFRSKAGKFSVFNWANEYCALQDKPTALKSYNNILYAFTESNIYAINPNNLSIIDKMEGAGALSQKSIIATDYGMFFADKYGVYLHNGKASKIISTPIYSSDNTDLTNFTWDSISTSLETSPPMLAFDGERKALMVIFEVSNSSYAWVYSVMTRRWDFWTFVNKVKSITQGKFGEIIASDGKLMQIGTSSTRKAWEFQSKKITAGFDTYDKSFSEIHTEGSSGLVTKYKNASNSSFQTLTSNRVSSSDRKSKSLQVQVVDDNGQRTLESIGVHLRPIKARSSKV
tara:strand:+ start:1901 stop:5827 length:3927 start_codon:yes stop_codon:yes gene_type:complete